MLIPQEPKWMGILDKYFWVYLYIIVILTIAGWAGSAQAQDKKICVDEWRLVKAEQELILLDSLVLDFKEKDSVIADLKVRDTVRLSEISHLKFAYSEKILQVDMHRDLSIGYAQEIHILNDRNKSLAWQRNGAVVLAVVITLICLL